MFKRFIQYAALSAFITTSGFAEQILKRALEAEPQSLFPPKSSDIPSYQVTRDLYEGLVSCDMQGKIIPAVADKWELDASGKVYTFHLRPNAKWSNGDPVKAQDFEFAWRHMISPATASAYAFIMYPLLNAEAINKGEEKDVTKLGVKAINDSTLEVTLKAPTPYLMQLMLHHSFFPIHKASLDEFKDEVAKPGKLVSNGAFLLSDWRPQEYVMLSKNTHYWDAAHVKLDKVQFFTSDDGNTTLKRYRAGEIDMTYKVPAEKLLSIKADPKLKNDLKQTPYLGTYYYGINLTKSPLGTSKDLREALSLALDREMLCEKVSRAGEQPAYGFVPPQTANSKHASVSFVNLTKEDRIKRAQELYKKAGYTKDKPLEMELLYNTDESHKKMAIAAADMWKKVLGVKVKLLNKEWKVFLADRREKKVTEIFRAGWIGDYNDPYSFLEVMASSSALNDLGFKDEAFDKLLHQGSETTDLVKRAVILGEAEKLFLDMHAVIPVYHYVTARLVSPKIKGYELGGNNLLDIYYSKDLEVAG